MNLPNKLTVTRLILVPVFFISYELRYWGADPLPIKAMVIASTILMVLCYAIAELSDLLDGKIARKHNLVTDLGKVLDPFADTLSHLTFFTCFVGYGIMPIWTFVIIMWREFGILFIRMLMMRVGKPMPANIFGKSKTVFYAITTFLSIAYITCQAFLENGSWMEIGGIVLYVFFSLSALAALLSFTTYLYSVFKNKYLSGMTR